MSAQSTQGIDWLSQVRPSWPTATLGRVGRFHMGTTFPHAYQGASQGDFPFVKVSDFSRANHFGVISTANNWVDLPTARQLGARMVPAGSVLYARVGAALLLNQRCLTGRTCIVDDNVRGFNPHSGDPRYWRYLMLLLDMGEIANSGPVPSVSERQVAALKVPVPPAEEQRRIADFLDAETARIDQMSLLRGRQAELINDAAFTRVYDTVRGAHVVGDRKDSGLPWLGSVPSEWRVAAVSHHFEVELGKMLNQERTQGEYLRPYLRVANVQWDHIEVGDLAVMDFPPEDQARYRLKPGDLLVNEGGSWPGRAAIWNGEVPEVYYQKALHRIRARGNELPRWLYYCLLVAERLRVFQVQGNSSTMTHLTREQLRPQRFPFPDGSQQDKLVTELDRAAKRDRAVQKLLVRQMGLIAERRQALITAAVTGQIDVTSASGRNVTDGVHP